MADRFFIGDILYHNYKDGDCITNVMAKPNCRYSRIMELWYNRVSQINDKMAPIICATSLGLSDDLENAMFVFKD